MTSGSCVQKRKVKEMDENITMSCIMMVDASNDVISRLFGSWGSPTLDLPGRLVLERILQNTRQKLVVSEPHSIMVTSTGVLVALTLKRLGRSKKQFEPEALSGSLGLPSLDGELKYQLIVSRSLPITEMLLFHSKLAKQ